MKTPILETERLILRPLTVADAQEVFENWTSDPEVARFMRWERHADVSVTRQWLEGEESAVDSDAVYDWGFVLKETGELIGSGGLVFQKEKRMYELGYNIMKKYWNRGLTTEAATEIVDFAKNVLKCKRLYCGHAKDNPASGRVMVKVGFEYTGDGAYSSFDGKRTFEMSEYLLVLDRG